MDDATGIDNPNDIPITIRAFAELQQEAAAWHAERRLDLDPGKLIIKAMEELGEVSKAYHGRGDMPAEAGDVVVALAILVGAFFPDRDLLVEANRKFDALLVSDHPYAAGDWERER